MTCSTLAKRCKITTIIFGKQELNPYEMNFYRHFNS
jgi:hypothetical protein